MNQPDVHSVRGLTNDDERERAARQDAIRYALAVLAHKHPDGCDGGRLEHRARCRECQKIAELEQMQEAG